MKKESVIPVFKTKYEIGEACWISVTGDQELTRGTVVQSFESPLFTSTFYIIALGFDFPHFEVRDALLMSATKDGPLPAWTMTDERIEG